MGRIVIILITLLPSVEDVTRAAGRLAPSVLMQQVVSHPGVNTTTAAVAFALVAFAGGALWWQLRELRIRVSTIGAWPLIMTAGAVWVVSRALWIGPWLTAAVTTGLLLGVVAGVMRARLMTVRMDPAAGVIYARGNPVSALFWFALAVIKAPVRMAAYQAESHHGMILAGCLSAAFVSVALGSVVAARLCWYVRFQEERRGRMPV